MQEQREEQDYYPSILESKYNEPNRPISHNELAYMYKKLNADLRLSTVFAHHADCGHIYATRQGSRKEFSIKNGSGCGNCSVCWKLKNTTPTELKEKAKDIVAYHSYSNEAVFYSSTGSANREIQSPVPSTYSMFDICNVYYRWLYERV